MRSLPLLPPLALLAACGASRSTPAPPPPPFAVTFSEVAGSLGQVTDLGFLPDGRMVIVQKTGEVLLRSTAGGIASAGSFDVDSSSEKGLLGVAVDPAFDTTHRLFFYYSRSSASGGTDLDRHRVVSIQLGAGGTLDGPTEAVLVSGLRGPANHDGGGMAIGPDGMLYVGVGDTGCNSGLPPEPPVAPSNYFATCLTNGNGKILRVALDGGIPADDPLATVPQATACGASCGDAPAATAAPRADLWAWGFRNPWRFAFDPATGLLWVGDVGEVTYEEVTVVKPGRHHGWPWREGGRGWPVSKCRETVPDTGDCVDPAYFCAHGAGGAGIDGGCQSITGGPVVDAPPWPMEARGRYWFADNANGSVFTLQLDAARTGVVPGSRRAMGTLGGGPVSIRLGPDGLLYVAVLGGRVVRIAPGP
jgi:glucose/arabinose dehydrogenase